MLDQVIGLVRRDIAFGVVGKEATAGERARGVPVVFGDAAAHGVVRHAGDELERAIVADRMFDHVAVVVVAPGLVDAASAALALERDAVTGRIARGREIDIGRGVVTWMEVLFADDAASRVVEVSHVVEIAELAGDPVVVVVRELGAIDRAAARLVSRTTTRPSRSCTKGCVRLPSCTSTRRPAPS